MKLIYMILLCLLNFQAMSGMAYAAELAGLWQEYNDDTGKVEALIRIEKTGNGNYEGVIEKLIPDTVEKNATRCTLCTGSLHNRPLLGLRILSNLQRRDHHTFEGGEITDPDDGKVYRCKISLSENGSTIEVTGYLNFNWIGHSEVWRRVRPEATYQSYPRQNRHAAYAHNG